MANILTGLQRAYELNGNALDSSPNAAHGTAVSMAYTSGKYSQQAGTFPNVAGRRVTAPAFNQITGITTIAGWARLLGTPSGASSIGTIVLQGDGHPGNNNYWLTLQGPSAGIFLERHRGNNPGAVSAGTFSTGVWKHFVWEMNYTGGLQKLWINGVLVYNTTPAYPGGYLATSTDFQIGGASASTAPANADYQQILVWNRALSQDDVDLIYNADTGRAYPFGFAPTITNVSPSSGSLDGGTAITITGTNFDGTTTVTIGGVPCTSVVLTGSTTITCVTPAGTVGSQTLVVTTNSPALTVSSSFTYEYNQPTITSINPAITNVRGLVPLTLTGTNFVDGMTITVGGTACTGVVRRSSTEISCILPAKDAGIYDVTVSINPSFTLPAAITFTDVLAALVKYGGGSLDLDTLSWSNAMQPRKLRKLLSQQSGTRPTSLTAVATIQTVPGYTIQTGFNDIFPMGYNNTWYAIQLEPGFYADIFALGTALQAEIDAVIGAGLVVLERGAGGGNRYWLDPVGSFNVGFWAFLPLVSYFGFTPDAVGTFASVGTAITARNSFYPKLAVDFQLLQLALRFGMFGRSAQ